MAFVLKQSDSYRWPVTIRLPADGGRREKQTFEAEFKRVTQSRVQEMQDQARQMVRAVQSDETFEGLNDVTAAGEVLIGWSGVIDEDGEQVPFSEAAKDQLLEIPMVAAAIIQAFFESLIEQKRKN